MKDKDVFDALSVRFHRYIKKTSFKNIANFVDISAQLGYGYKITFAQIEREVLKRLKNNPDFAYLLKRDRNYLQREDESKEDYPSLPPEIQKGRRGFKIYDLNSFKL